MMLRYVMALTTGAPSAYTILHDHLSFSIPAIPSIYPSTSVALRSRDSDSGLRGPIKAVSSVS